jgi:hypothetical protein
MVLTIGVVEEEFVKNRTLVVEALLTQGQKLVRHHAKLVFSERIIKISMHQLINIISYIYLNQKAPKTYPFLKNNPKTLF